MLEARPFAAEYAVGGRKILKRYLRAVHRPVMKYDIVNDYRNYEDI
jgi:hypothetical protein